jgi:adenylate kinase
MKIVLFGAPGSGKGTQAKLINAEFGLPQISTGDLLRSHIAKETELGKIAKEYINKGELVPDKLVIELVKNRIKEEDCKKGYILDGFPRTYEQAIQLDKIDKIDLVLYIDITMHEVEKRALNRRVCPACGKIFSIANKYIENCECGAKLVQRDDDRIEVVRERIKTYLAQSEPLIEYYKKKKILFTIFSGETAEMTYKEVKKIILPFFKKK